MRCAWLFAVLLMIFFLPLNMSFRSCAGGSQITKLARRTSLPSSICIHSKTFLSRLGAKAGPNIIIVGGGPSGYFTSIQLSSYLREHFPRISPTITILESTSKPLRKVLISGGGRCNLLPDTRKPASALLLGYPLGRGRKELISPTSESAGVTPTRVLGWFNENGVETKIEEDGRTFPITDDSGTVRDALEGARHREGVGLKKGVTIDEMKMDEVTGLYEVKGARRWGDGKVNFEASADAVVIATGSSQKGWDVARGLGIEVVKPVPSLFTLRLAECGGGGVLEGLQGVSVERAEVRIIPGASPAKGKGRSQKEELSQVGPILITHVGISGPAALKTSAYGARVLAEEVRERKGVGGWRHGGP